ncbi:MAG: hypothetical protein NXY57DRAFT_890042, partial [Lentinula lateritia]
PAGSLGNRMIASFSTTVLVLAGSGFSFRFPVRFIELIRQTVQDACAFIYKQGTSQ